MANLDTAGAFTGSGLIAQLPYLLIVLALMAGRFDRARMLVAVAAAIGLAHALFESRSGPAAFWWGLILITALALLAKKLMERAAVRFTPDEESMRATLLAGLTRSNARHLLDQGFWLTAKEGDVLTHEGEPVSHLYYLASGEAVVTSQGRQVGRCRAGDLIGEVTVLSGDQASATVTLTSPARFWCAPASVLRPYVEAHDDVRRALEQSFTKALRSKLRASNERLAEAGGLAGA
jgi:hypothetical protein